MGDFPKSLDRMFYYIGTKGQLHIYSLHRIIFGEHQNLDSLQSILRWKQMLISSWEFINIPTRFIIMMKLTTVGGLE
jgi:hypothetical protein